MILLTIHRLPLQNACVLTDDNYIVLDTTVSNSANGHDYSSLPAMPEIGSKFAPSPEWEYEGREKAVEFAGQQRWEVLYGAGNNLLPYMTTPDVIAACNALDAKLESSWDAIPA